MVENKFLKDIKNNPELKKYVYYENENGVLYKGDCIEIMKHFPGECFDMILTDPPYGISFKSNRTKHQREIKNDKYEDWLKLINVFLPEFKRLLYKKGVCACFCGGGGGKVPTTAIFTLEAIKHLKLIQTLVWKKSIGLGWHYRPAYENIILLCKDPENYYFFDLSKNLTNVLEYEHYIPQKGDHPTQKPLELMEKLLVIHTEYNFLVLDPFAGSGSTLVACEKLGRKWIGIEIDEEYCSLAKKRIMEEYKQLKMF